MCSLSEHGVRPAKSSWSGVLGPGLTTNAFNAGINNLQTTVTNVATQRLDFERARAERSFTEKHGAALAQRMHRSCDVANDNHLRPAKLPWPPPSWLTTFSVTSHLPGLVSRLRVT